MNYKKRGLVKRFLIVAVIALAAVIAIVSLLWKESQITGRVTQGEENVFSENLRLVVNESGTYEWKMKNPGDIKSLKASGAISSNGSAKVYIEKNGTRRLLFDSTKQLFDIDISVLPEFKKSFQGDEILVQIIMFNLRGFGAGSVNAKYFIKDDKGNIVAEQEESIYVETQAKFIRKLVIPEEIKPGTYLASVEVLSNATRVGAGSDTFEIRAKYENVYAPELMYYAIVLAVIIGAVILVIFLVYLFKRLKRKRNVVEIEKKVPLEKMSRMKRELKALEEAYSSKFISKESYSKDRERIETQLKRMKNEPEG